MRLDVGCGPLPTGDINVDLFLEYSPHVGGKIHGKNFVRADAHNLPFRDSCIDEIYCSHTLEHLSQPQNTLIEFKRVMIKRCVIVVPNASYLMEQYGDRKYHLYSWTPPALENLGKSVFNDECKVYENKPLSMLVLQRFRNSKSSIIRRLVKWVAYSLAKLLPLYVEITMICEV